MKKMIIILIMLIISNAVAENVDPYNSGEKYGWGENVGWLNAKIGPNIGMHVEDDKVTGWLWGENIGWINLHCENNATCGSVAFGVANDGAGNLSGFAWAENVGWINFNPVVSGDPTHYGVRITSDGKLSGWAWGENIGWINFDETEVWSLRICIVTLEDLRNFASDWLQFGTIPANLDNVGRVDVNDFSIISKLWLDFCPDGWQLK